MARKAFAIALGLIVVVIGVSVIFAIRATKSDKPYVFINETSDHRFDESIRMSIVAAQARTGVQNAVVITDDFPVAEGPERFATRLFESLGVGRSTDARGILYFYSPASKTLKIEVSYKLEGVLTDLRVGGLERAAKTFVYSDRYQDFWAELINTLNIEIENAKEGNRTQSALPAKLQFKYLSGGAGVSSLNYAALSQLKDELKEQKTTSPNTGRSVDSVVDQYFASLAQGLGEDDSNILSRESQFARRIVPLTSFQLYRNWEMYQKVSRDRTFEVGPLAFVFFKAGQPVLPIILKKQDGSWRIQEPMAWALFQRFEDSLKVFLKFKIDGATKEMNSYLQKRFGDPLYPSDVSVSIDTLSSDQLNLEKPQDAFFQLFGIDLVVSKLESRLPTLSKSELFLLIDSESNLGRFSKFKEAYRVAASKYSDPTVQKNLEFYENLPVLDDSKWQLTRK
jgi:TPM domain